ncbi:MAG: carbohydrate kinase [Opitutales bacterium]
MDTAASPSGSVYCFGEVLWDCFPDHRQRIGGAPFNVAAHLARLGGSAHLISAVGYDPLGAEALAALQRHGLSSTHVAQHRDLPTGTVQVTLDASGQPSYHIVEPAAWDRIVVSEALLDAVGKPGQVLVYGSLAARSQTNLRLLQRLLDRLHPTAWPVFDVNLRPPYDDLARIGELAQHASWLKLNDAELAVLSGCSYYPDTIEKVLQALAERFNLSRITLTLGERGAIHLADGALYRVPGRRIDVADTVGAGDAFVAALLMGAFPARSAIDWAGALQRANALAAFVASQAGAVPAYDPDVVLGDEG